jgi:hypothetical protein
MAALGELETLMAQPAVPIFSEAFDPFYFTDDLQLNNRRMGLDSVEAIPKPKIETMLLIGKSNVHDATYRFSS